MIARIVAALRFPERVVSVWRRRQKCLDSQEKVICDYSRDYSSIVPFLRSRGLTISRIPDREKPSESK